MKNTLLILVGIICIAMGCTQQSDKEACHLTTADNKLSINFTEGDAQRVVLSPFEKNKVVVEFWNSDHPSVEFDLITKDTQLLKLRDWKKIYSRSSPVYRDTKDSIVWVGGVNIELLKYDQKRKKATLLPIKYVHKIIPYQSKIYFVAHSGLYVKNSASEEIKKVPNLPLMSIQDIELLGKTTLILDAKITYDLATDTWKEGIHLHQEHAKGNYWSFKTKDGVAIFLKDEQLYYSTAADIKVLPLSKQLGVNALHIDYPYISGRGQHGMDRYNIQTGELVTFDYRLPKVNNYSPNFSYDKNIIWIYRPGQLYFINTITGESHNYPITASDNFKSMTYDECHIYLLYEKRLEVIEKTEFIERCPKFSISDYLAELQAYKIYIDSTGITKEANERKVVQQLKTIKARYANVTHPEILKQLDYLDLNAFQNVKHETIADFQDCYTNEELPKKKRISCFQTLIRKEVLNSNFQEVLKQETVFKKFFDPTESEMMSYYHSNIDSIRSYVTYCDSIEKTNIAADTIAYYKAMAFNSICQTAFFCHQGCGGCNYSLVINALIKFKRDFPNSLLVDNAALELLEYSYMYEEEYDPQRLIDLEAFKDKYPNSDKLKEIELSIIWDMQSRIEEINKNSLLEKLEYYKESYPTDKHIKNIDYWIKELQ